VRLAPGCVLRAVDPARDLAAVGALLAACDVEDLGEPDHPVDWIAETWSSPMLAGAWVVERDATVVAYLELESIGVAFDAYIPVRPDLRVGDLRRELMRFAEQEVRTRMTAGEVDFRATGGVEDPTFVPDCEAIGLTHVRTFLHLQRALDPSEPAGPPPAGVQIRPSVDPDDDGVVHGILDAAFQGHFGIESMSLEQWRSSFKDGLYDPGLVLIAEVDGVPAGVAANWMPDGLGWVGDLGVLAEHRGRGVGTALLRHSFALLAARGASLVRLNVDAGNRSGATRLYASVGMTERRRFMVFEKQVRAAG
jgi:mycothiol synthase